MNMDKWIEENSTAIEDRGTCSVSYFVNEDKFRELLKTHAIVPREPSWNMKIAGEKVPQFSDDIYKAMIKASEIE